MRLLNLSIISAAISLFITCCKEPARPAPQPTSMEKLNILWRTSIVPNIDRDYSISMNPVLYNNFIVFNSEYTINEQEAPVLFLDTANGEILNYWSDYEDGHALYSGETSASEKGYLFLSTHTSIDCLNLETGQTQWQGVYGNNGPHIYTSEGYVYRAIEFNGGSPTEAAILRSPVQTEVWDTIYSFIKTDKYSPSFDSFGFGNLENGDEVIVWKNRNWGAAGFLTDIFAYNLTADTLMWRNREMDASSSIVPLRIANGIIYGEANENVFALSLAGGELLWRKNINSHILLNYSNVQDIYVSANQLLIFTDSEYILSLNPMLGDIQWVKGGNGGGLRDRVSYFEGKLFFPSGGLRIVDVTNAEPLISETLSEEIDDIKSKIVIDPDRRVMYFHNGREAFCVKIPTNL